MRSTAYQSIHDAEDQFWSDVSGNADLAAIWESGLDGGVNALQPHQRPQFQLAINRLIYLYQNVHYQRRKGVVDDELWYAWVASPDEFLLRPGYRDVLAVSSSHLKQDF